MMSVRGENIKEQKSNERPPNMRTAQLKKRINVNETYIV